MQTDSFRYQPSTSVWVTIALEITVPSRLDSTIINLVTILYYLKYEFSRPGSPVSFQAVVKNSDLLYTALMEKDTSAAWLRESSSLSDVI